MKGGLTAAEMGGFGVGSRRVGIGSESRVHFSTGFLGESDRGFLRSVGGSVERIAAVDMNAAGSALLRQNG